LSWHNGVSRTAAACAQVGDLNVLERTDGHQHWLTSASEKKRQKNIGATRALVHGMHKTQSFPCFEIFSYVDDGRRRWLGRGAECRQIFDKSIITTSTTTVSLVHGAPPRLHIRGVIYHIFALLSHWRKHCAQYV